MARPRTMGDAARSPGVKCQCADLVPTDAWSAQATGFLAQGAVLILDVRLGVKAIAAPSADQDARRAAAMPAHKRCLFLTTRHAAQMALAAETGCDPTCIRIEASGDTRPRLAGLMCNGPRAEAVREFEISFSYAGKRALVAIARGVQVGVDIEPLPPRGERTRRYDTIRETYFADMPDSGDRETCNSFMAGWTRHEAFLKACGDGITIPAQRRDPAAEGYTIRNIDAGTGYVAAVAAKTATFKVEILPASPLGQARELI